MDLVVTTNRDYVKKGREEVGPLLGEVDVCDSAYNKTSKMSVQRY
jgi:hypothetical protein